MTTTNPVPSNDPTDLLFNAQKLDQVVNGSAQYYTDRLGVNRRTMEGISAAADVVLGGIGYAPPVAYASGISLTLTTQTVEYSGEVYAPKLVNLPFTTSTWATDSAKFRLIQGVAATDLAASGGSAMIGYTPAGTGAVATTVQSKMRESVSVKDFGAIGDEVTDDTVAVLAAIATGKDVDFLDLNCRVTQQILLNSNQTLFASNGGGITGDVVDYVLRASGSTGSAISSVTAPVVALTWTITMASPAGLVAGDQILLYDVVADEYEVNRIQTIISNTVYTTWAITQNFATPANIRLYKLTPIQNAKLVGMTIRNTNASNGAGVRFGYTKDCEIVDCTFDTIDYISCSIESSIGATIHRNKFIRSGASAVGLRVTKACRITKNQFVDTQSDESITLYKSNSHAVVAENNVAQYLFGGGGTAGNSILLDQHNYYNTIVGNVLNGSATYHIYLFNNSSYNTVVGNTIARANLGAIKVDSNSNGNTIDNNICVAVVDATDSFEGGAATAAIRVKSNCSGNIIGPGNTFASLAGVQIVDQQAVSGNVPQQLKGPTFSAYQSVAQTLSSGVITVINFQTEEFDTDGAYNTSTSRFQPAVAGYYQINANVAVASSPSGVNARILKNGTLWKAGGNASGNYAYSSGVSSIVHLNGTTDFVEIAAIFSVGQNTEALSASTWFNGAFLRA